MPTTNVPQPVFGPNGFIAPAESAVLEGVQEDINAAFGGNLNPALSTPQGQLASSEAAIIAAGNNTFVFLTNMFDPAYSLGRYQDALARIYFITRFPALPTVLQIQCNGAAGVNIPYGALIQDTSGNYYICTDPGTISAGGNVTLSFSCTVPGPVPVPGSGDVSIAQAIPQWDAVSCTSGVVGQNTETRAAFETRRERSVAANSQGMVASVLGNVLSVSGVLDAYAIENPLSTPVVNGSGNAAYTLVPNSIYVAATGGSSAAIAFAIFQKKAPGCNYNGNTSVEVQDPNPVYGGDGPTYDVMFEIPPSLPILFSVSFASSPSIPSNATSLVQAALLSAFAGGDGGPRARMGTTLLATRFVAPVLALGSWAMNNLLSLAVGSSNAPSATIATSSISGTTLTVGSAVSGALAVGQTLVDATGDIAPGTTILSGSGSSWTVSVSQTVASETMYGVLATGNSVGVGINQEPTLAAADIAVSIA